MICRHAGHDFVLGMDGHMGNKIAYEETWTLRIAKAVSKFLEG